MSPPGRHAACRRQGRALHRLRALSPPPPQALRDGRANGVELAEAMGAARKLQSSAAETASRLRALRGDARKYSDADYAAHAGALLECAAAVGALASRLRVELLPRVAAARDAHAAAAAARARAAAAAAAAAGGGGAAAAGAAAAGALARALAELGPPPGAALPSPPASAWRYPPRPYVLHKRKGLRGGWAAPLAMPGLKRPLPALRRVDLLPVAEGGAPLNGGAAAAPRAAGGSAAVGAGAEGAEPLAGRVAAGAEPGAAFSGMFD
jgi:hypothetical protein